MQNWRQVLAWETGPVVPEWQQQERDRRTKLREYRDRHRNHDETVHRYYVSYSGNASASSTVFATTMDEAYDLARHGYEYDFEVGESGDSWDIYHIEDAATGEGQDFDY